MANIAEIVDTFLTQMVSLPDRGCRSSLDAILGPALLAEKQLRLLMVQDPNHPILMDPYVGLLDVFSIPQGACRTRPRSFTRANAGYVHQEDFVCLFPHQYLLELDPAMRRPTASQCFVECIEDFERNWDIFTHHAFSGISDWSNIVIAGGSVLACLTPFPPNMTNIEIADFYHSSAYNESDIDVFLFGLSVEQAKSKMVEMYEQIKKAIPAFVTCVRKANTISIHTAWPNRPIQIVLRLYTSPAEILAGFDIDSACCLYDGNTVFVNPRGLIASVRQCNTVDLSRRSSSYEVRLAKYADRGFEVYYPALDRAQVNAPLIYDRNLARYPTGLGRLLVIEMIRCYPDFYHRLYSRKPRPSIKRKTPNRTGALDFRPVERLLANNYDYSYLYIPYEKNWDAHMVERLVRRADIKINSSFNIYNMGRRLHRHVATCGAMNRVVRGSVCFGCPEPITVAEEELVVEEQMIHIRGQLQFIETDPGRQIITGSFRPLTADDWSASAYFNNADGNDEELMVGRVPDDNTAPRRASLHQVLTHALEILAQDRDGGNAVGASASGYTSIERLLSAALSISTTIEEEETTRDQVHELVLGLEASFSYQ